MKPQDFADQLEACAEHKVSLDDFENWFERNSWDIHKQSDPVLTRTVFRIESLLSALDDGRVIEADLMARFRELANTIRPFVVDRLTMHESCGPDGQVLLRLEKVDERNVPSRPSSKSSDVRWNQLERQNRPDALVHQFQHALL
jgi:hypothetical protein